MPGYELIDYLEKQAVCDIFEQGGTLFAHGFDMFRTRYHVREFEQACQEYFGASHACAVSSGTAALKCALKSAGVQPGDEVITQPFNFVATVEAIVDCGARPIICDIDENLHISLSSLPSLLTSRTKCIIVVHMLGMMGPTRQLSQFCNAHNLILIEDACESVGAYSQGRSVGLQGDIGVYSFDHGKNLTCGEGGMCITDNQAYASYIRSYSDHGHAFTADLPRGQDDVVMPGFNHRMTEMQAAVGKVQLSKLSSLIKLNRERYDILYANLSPYFSIRASSEPDDVPSFDTFMLLGLDFSRINLLMAAVKEAGFGTKNVPDAMKWHCSFYWHHLLDQDQLIPSHKALLLLEQSLAIPILASKPLEAYLNLSRLILSLAH